MLKSIVFILLTVVGIFALESLYTPHYGGMSLIEILVNALTFLPFNIAGYVMFHE